MSRITLDLKKQSCRVVINYSPSRDVRFDNGAPPSNNSDMVFRHIATPPEAATPQGRAVVDWTGRDLDSAIWRQTPARPHPKRWWSTFAGIGAGIGEVEHGRDGMVSVSLPRLDVKAEDKPEAQWIEMAHPPPSSIC